MYVEEKNMCIYISTFYNTGISSLFYLYACIHGLRTPSDIFFSKIQNGWAWTEKFGGILGFEIGI